MDSKPSRKHGRLPAASTHPPGKVFISDINDSEEDLSFFPTVVSSLTQIFGTMSASAPPPGSPPSKGTPPTTRPSSPSPSRSGFRTLARVGTMFRRNSTSLLPNRQSLSRSASKSSLRSDTMPSLSAGEPTSVPSPVAESPVREAAAIAAESDLRPPLGPSPLAQEAKATPQGTPAPQPSMILTAEPVPIVPVPQPAAPAPQVKPAEPQTILPPAQPAAVPQLTQPTQTATPAAQPTQPVPQTAPAPQPTQPTVASKPAESVLAAASATQPAPVSQVQSPAAIPAPQPIIPPVPAIPEPSAQPISNTPANVALSHQEVAGGEASIFSAEPQFQPFVEPPVPIEQHGPDYFSRGNVPITEIKQSGDVSIAEQNQATVSSASALGSAPIKTAEHYADPYAANSFAWKDENLATSSRRSSVSVPRMPSHDQLPVTSPKQPTVALSKPPSQEPLVASPKASVANISKSPSREQLIASPKQSAVNISRPPSREQFMASPPQVQRTLSPKPSQSSIASSYGQPVVNVSAGGRQVAVSVDPNVEPPRGRSRSRASTVRSVRISWDDGYTDPFADPPSSSQTAIPYTYNPALSPIASIDTPMEPSIPMEMAFPKPEHQPITEEPEHDLHEASPAPISMPLPEPSEVMNTRVIRQEPSAYSIGASSGFVDHAPPSETNERLPLLPRMPQPDISKAPGTSDVTTGAGPANGIPWPSIPRSYASLGWTQHVLPDSTVYYYHQGMQVTTEMDLRQEKKLEGVMQYLNSKSRGGPVLPPFGWELWLRNAGQAKYDFTPIKGFVSHKERILTFETPQTAGASVLSEDDKLDNEYRYWSYLESHPAHVVLPQEAHNEAMDALRWCYADCLVPSRQAVPQLFAPQECQELMGLLRSSGEDLTSPSIVHTRIVSRVLLRKVQWRQQRFRPDKPLPGDASRAVPEHRTSIRRVIVDIIVSILCLGIPYLFMGRSSSRRLDEEGGMRSQGPLLVIGACSCLVAAVILSASVTLLTLPGLDDISRLAGMIAILFSASSMVSAVVALFKYRADLERTVVYVGGEGLMVLSRRSIVMSLPLVFLAWSIAAFVTGITFYSFRGVTLVNKVVIQQPFDDYTHWALVGGLGGVAGVLLVSILLSG